MRQVSERRNRAAWTKKRREQTTAEAEAFPPIGDESACLHWLWTTLYAPDGVSTVCRHCRVMRRFHRVTRRRAYACDHCGTQVYPTAGTFMQGSGLGVATWFAGAWQLMEGDGNVAPRALADELGVSYKTALRIKRKLEEALAPGSADADLLERLRRDAGGPGALAAGVPARDRSSRARENIRAAACRAFAARGPSATRIADIAREAGVSSAIIHYYYKSKDEVLLAALQWANEHTSRQLHELRQETDDPIELLRRTIDLAIPSEGVLRDEYVLWIETWARVRLHPRLLAECAAMSEALDGLLRAAGRGRRGGRGVPSRRAARRDRPAHGRPLRRAQLPLRHRLHGHAGAAGAGAAGELRRRAARRARGRARRALTAARGPRRPSRRPSPARPGRRARTREGRRRSRAAAPRGLASSVAALAQPTPRMVLAVATASMASSA